jgi:hypothetical protein
MQVSCCEVGLGLEGNSIKKYNQVTDYSRTERVTTASKYVWIPIVIRRGELSSVIIHNRNLASGPLG